jgi:hypothetical protein
VWQPVVKVKKQGVAKIGVQQMTWMAEPGTYLTGQEAIDTLDLLALTMERKWGADRLRLLVPEELRTKFDRQRLLTNQAIWSGELEDVTRETRRMATAWRALDAAADKDAANHLPPVVWEVPLEDGSVAQIVRDASQASQQAALMAQSGRKVSVYSLAEVGRLLSKFPTLCQTLATFPGSTITAVRQSVADPLNNMEA